MRPHHILRHPLVRSAGSLAAGTVAAQVLVFAATPLLTRVYRPAEMGGWGVYAALAMTIAQIAALRLDATVVLPAKDTEAQTVLHAAQVTNLWFSGAIIILAPLVLQRFDTFRELPAWIWVALLPMNILALGQYQILVYWLTRKGQFAEIARTRVHQALATAACQLLLGMLGWGASGLILGTLLGSGAAWVTARRACRGSYRALAEPRGTAETLRLYWRMPVLNGVSAISDSIRTNFVNLALATRYGPSTLGQFSLSWRVALTPISLVSSSISQVLYSSFASKRDGTLTRQAMRSVGMLAGLGLIPFATLFFYGQEIFGFAFGEEWRTAGLYAELLTPYLYLAFATSPLSNLLVVTGAQALLAMFSLAYLACASFAITRGADAVASIQTFSLTMAGMLFLLALISLASARRHDRAMLAAAAERGLA